MKNKLIYLACPYSHKDPVVRLKRFRQVSRFAGRMIKAGLMVYSPISHSHPIAEAYKSAGFAWEHWIRLDFEMIDRCDELWVLMLSGWNNSVGVFDEAQRAKDLGMPIRYVGKRSPL